MTYVVKYARWVVIVLVIGLISFLAVRFSHASSVNDGSDSNAATASIISQKALPDSAYKTTSLIMHGSASAQVKQSFTALIADTDALQELGLSYRNSLAKNEAMIFVFPQLDEYDFWMKGMKFPLDIIWLSADKKIIYIEKDLSPATYPDAFGPSEDSQYVIEVVAGTADRLGLAPGQSMSF